MPLLNLICLGMTYLVMEYTNLRIGTPLQSKWKGAHSIQLMYSVRVRSTKSPTMELTGSNISSLARCLESEDLR